MQRLLILVCLTWSVQGLSETDFNRSVDRLMASYSGDQVPGAAVLVIHEGAIQHKKGYGLANVENGAMADEFTNYRLASVSKAFTALSIVLLKERGLIDYEAPMTTYIKDFPSYGKRIKIRHLLHHQSGLRDYESRIPRQWDRQVSDADVVEILRRQGGTYFTPGTQYRYSNAGYATLAHIVSLVSGQSFAEFLEEHIFTPLGMDESVAFEDGVSVVNHRAYGYTRSRSGYRRTDQSQTSAVLGDGGVYSSLNDMEKWDRALYSLPLVSQDSMRDIFTPGRLSNGRRTSYGFGWTLDRRHGMTRQSHTGSTIGFRHAFSRYPEEQFSVLVLVNRASSSPWSIADRITELYFKK